MPQELIGFNIWAYGSQEDFATAVQGSKKYLLVTGTRFTPGAGGTVSFYDFSKGMLFSGFASSAVKNDDGSEDFMIENGTFEFNATNGMSDPGIAPRSAVGTLHISVDHVLTPHVYEGASLPTTNPADLPNAVANMTDIFNADGSMTCPVRAGWV